jgi:hypothetical protein
MIASVGEIRHVIIPNVSKNIYDQKCPGSELQIIKVVAAIKINPIILILFLSQLFCFLQQSF